MTGSTELSDITDPRVIFLAEYVLKTFNQKTDKWTKIYNIEENKILINDFLEKTDCSLLIFTCTAAGSLQVTYTNTKWGIKKEKKNYFFILNLRLQNFILLNQLICWVF